MTFYIHAVTYQDDAGNAFTYKAASTGNDEATMASVRESADLAAADTDPSLVYAWHSVTIPGDDDPAPIEEPTA